MKNKFLSIFFVLFVLVFCFPQKTLAAFSMSIVSIDPVSVSSNESEVTVTASISGLPSDSFFRAEWQKSSGSEYFGYSKNNSGSWIKMESGQDCKNYYSVTKDTDSLTLITKIGNDNNPANGTYGIKIRRYTSTCATSVDSDSRSIEINLPTTAPTPAPTVNPTKTPVPTNSPTSVPVKPKITTTPSPRTPNPTPVNSVLGIESTPSPTPTDSKNKAPFAGIFLVGLGILFIIASVYMAYRTSRSMPLSK